MTLVLTTRAGNGAPVTAAQNDANMNAIMTEVNATEASLSTLTSAAVTNTALNAMFAAQSGGKQQISWTNVLGAPQLNPNPFRAVLSGSTQVCSVTSGVTFTTKIGFNDAIFDPAAAFNTASNSWICPANGYYLLGGSLQVSWVSGSLSGAVPMNFSLQINGSGIDNSNIDTGANTGGRTYKICDLVSLSAGDTLTGSFSVINPIDDSVWQIGVAPDTNVWGFQVLAT